MVQLLYTDLIRSRTIQWLILLIVFAEITLAKSIKQSLLLIGVPYVISLVLGYKFKTKKTKQIKRVSYQYRPAKTIVK